MKLTIYDARGEPLHTFTGSRAQIETYCKATFDIMQANKHSFIIRAGSAELLHDCNYQLFVRYDNRAKVYKRFGNALNFIEKLEV